jgi:hypothetical protein
MINSRPLGQKTVVENAEPGVKGTSEPKLVIFSGIENKISTFFRTSGGFYVLHFIISEMFTNICLTTPNFADFTRRR